MAILQLVLDKKLLKAADEAARRTNKNRSALLRDALREHLRRIQIQAPEESDRAGYAKHPVSPDEGEAWEGEASWPAE
jgi:metal-responsive CopG/Arc/MetJ family transcriptional regulator